VKRKGGRRDLLQIKATYKAEIINIAEYLNTKYTEDQFVNIVKSQEGNQSNMNSTIKVAAKVVEELNQTNENSDTKKRRHSTRKSKLRRALKKNGKAIYFMASILEVWIDNLLVQKTAIGMFLWLLRGDLKGETESEIIAAQDQASQTKYHTTQYYKQKEITNADSLNNLMRQWNT
jgi:hypothetical protein